MGKLDNIPEFEAKIITLDNGKKTLLIKPHIENIVHPDGRKDVIIHVPTLELINKTKELHGIE